MTQANAPMHSDAFLKREQWIRFAGWLLVFSPAGNFFWTAALTGIPHWYTPAALHAFALSIPLLFWLIWASGFAVGCMMIAGRKAPWKLTLAILGMNIFFGLLNLKHDIQYGFLQTFLSLFINLSLFAALYFHEFHRNLEFKKWQERIKAAMPKRTLPQKHIPAVFDGMGEWAKLISITHDRVSFRSSLNKVPVDIEQRLIRIALSKDLSIPIRFSDKINHIYHFQILSVDEQAADAIKRLQAKLAT